MPANRQYFELSHCVQFDIVKQFCYLGDMLNCSGGADSAVTTRVRCGWGKFKELAPFLTSKGPSLHQKGKVYASCVRSCMVYGTETWPMTVEHMNKMERTEMRMVRWMNKVSLRDRIPSADLRTRCGIQPIAEVIRKNRLRWFGHVERKDDNDWVKKCMNIAVEGVRPPGRPKKTWKECVMSDLKQLGLTRANALDRNYWKTAIGGQRQTRVARRNASNR